MTRVRTPEQKKRNRERARQRRADRRAAGLCPKCGEPAADGLVLCERHNSINNTNSGYHLEYYHRKLKKPCPDCGGAREFRKSRCSPCLEAHKERMKAGQPSRSRDAIRERSARLRAELMRMAAA